MEAEARFRAMGTDVHVIVVGGPSGLPEVARQLVVDLEARWSRFRPTSEVSLLNLMAGRAVRVSPPTVTLVQRALEGVRLTGGRFDPTVLGDVIRAGYDRSFELLAAETREGREAPDGRSALRAGAAGLSVDPAGSTVTLPEGVGFDPGGIGKGYAADLVVGELLRRGAAGACANVGGDLRVEGAGPGGRAWTVALAHPFRPAPVAVVGLRGGAVATSMRTRRSWGSKDRPRHHLIDPSTGRPAHNGLASASVLAAEGWQAEVVAKAAFVAGVRGGLELLASTGTEGILVDDEGAVRRSPGFHRFTRPAPSPVPAGAP
jgi:FAD:protein FMN transferase